MLISIAFSKKTTTLRNKISFDVKLVLLGSRKQSSGYANTRCLWLMWVDKRANEENGFTASKMSLQFSFS